jgi:uncharacterized protein
MTNTTPIPLYPQFSELHISHRAILHPLLLTIPGGISEFLFANLYLFRHEHNYRIAACEQTYYVITGEDQTDHFFMLPFGLPAREILNQLFDSHGSMKCVYEAQVPILRALGYRVEEDRNNFDYLYRREDLAKLPGKKFHKKKNLVNHFLRDHRPVGKPLLEEYVPDALRVLDMWCEERGNLGDCRAATEALQRMEELQLCGGIFYIDSKPVGWTLGEEHDFGRAFVVHFEKAVEIDKYVGIYQYINYAFAGILPEKYELINREQDLGDPGLRQAKESYNPVGMVKKYRAWKDF